MKSAGRTHEKIGDKLKEKSDPNLGEIVARRAERARSRVGVGSRDRLTQQSVRARAVFVRCRCHCDVCV